MKKFYTSLPSCFTLCSLILLFSFSQTTFAQEQETTEDKTFSPRFYLPGGDTTLDALPLKSTSADVSIAGIIADVTVKQVYANEGTRVIEAKYVFPASTRAAVYFLQMRIGNRIMIAKIEEKEKAQEIYEEAVEEGKTATLLEQMTPNVFQMSVGNVLPGDTIEIEMKYTELLVPEESVYEFVFPTVVGPRYTGGNGEEWTEGPYQHEGEDPLYSFSINVNINAGMPLSEIYSISHPDVNIVKSLPEQAVVTPGPSGIKGNKDFILQYSLSGNSIQTGFLAYEGKDENFFLAMMQPPRQTYPGDIPPREYVFIMDVSGSMNGFPISVSKSLMKEVLQNLRTYDRFNILFFAGGSYLFSPASVLATEQNIQDAITAVESQTGGGGTELLPALKQALSLNVAKEYSRIFLILTDGYVSVEKEAFDLIRNNLGEANFFAFGIGSSVNRYIIEGIANVGQGEPFIAINETEAKEKAELFRLYIDAPVLTDIKAEFENFDAYDIEPLSIPDIFAERPVILFGKYKGTFGGKLNLSGSSGSTSYSNDIQIDNYSPDPKNLAIMYLWARKKIQLLDDYAMVSYENEEIKKEVVALGLKYNLLTAYTSFVVVDSVIRCDTCSAETVNQPLPMPEGVTDNALGWGGSGGRATTALTDSYSFNSPGKSKDETQVILVYPNPVESVLTVSIFVSDQNSEDVKKIRFLDALGRLVKEIDISSYKAGYNTILINIDEEFKDIVNGDYFMQVIIGSNNKYLQKITIKTF